MKKSPQRNTVPGSLSFASYGTQGWHRSQWTRPSPIHHQSRKRLLHKLTAQPNGVNSLTEFSTLFQRTPVCAKLTKAASTFLRRSWLSPECTCPVSDYLTAGPLGSAPLLWGCCLESADSRPGWEDRGAGSPSSHFQRGSGL